MTQEKPFYQSPQIEVIEIDVEQGFASSNPSGTEQYNPEQW